MRVFVMDCGGVLGAPLIRWLLTHTDAAIVGSGRSHDRLEALLEEPRFSFYTLDGGEGPALVHSLVEHADTVVDLTAAERSVPEQMPASDVQEELRAHTELVRLCADLGRRLVHVSSAEVYGHRWPQPVANGPITDAERQIREDEAPLVSGPVGDEELAVAHERMTQHLIYTYGQTESLDFVILRVFDVLGDRLETLPATERPGPVAQVRAALLARDGRTIHVEPDDLFTRTVIYVEDAAEAIGLVVHDIGSRVSGEVMNVGDPANRLSAEELARLVVDRYREKFWDGIAPIPAFAVTEVSVVDRQRHLRIPSIEKASRLLDWRPRWSLEAAVDAGLSGLLAPSKSANGTPR